MSACSERPGELLPEYVGGLLDPDEMKMVEIHLKNCSECAAEVRVLSHLEEEVLTQPPPWFWSSLPAKVTAQITSRRKARAWIMAPAWIGGLAGIAAVAFMLLQPGPVPQLVTGVPVYQVVETSGSIPLGLEEEILAVSGAVMDELDHNLVLDLKALPDEYTVGLDLIAQGYGYENMDEATMRIFEGLLEEMTPERVRERVMS